MGGRWLIIGLTASLALNLFLIGAGAGVVALGMRMARENAAFRPGVLVRATRDLPQPDRRNMRLMLRQAWNEVRPAAEQSRALRLEAWGAIGDATPNPAAIRLKLAQSRQLDLASRTKVEEMVVDYAQTLPAGDRAILAAGLRRALGPPPPAPAPAVPKN